MKWPLVLLASSLALLTALAQAAISYRPPPQMEAQMRDMFCGKGTAPANSATLPAIGCFGVPAGGTATTTTDGHQFAVAVDANGDATCRLDGSDIECAGCVGEHVSLCPTTLQVVSHNVDRSVTFSVKRRTDGNRYVVSAEGWNQYLERVKSSQPAPTAPSQPTLPAHTPPPMLAPPPVPPMPAGSIPGMVEATDGPNALGAIGFRAQAAYGSGQFAQLDALIDTLSQPDQLTDDGMPKLQGVYDGLWDFLYAWKDWQAEIDRVEHWRKASPGSPGPDLMEAIVWRAWAWTVRGEGLAGSVTPEGWKLFADKIARGSEVLENGSHGAASTPLGYLIRLGLARDAGWDHKRYRALFDEATRKYPWHVSLYLWAANYLSPLWGGSYEAVDALALNTTKTPLGADHSLYTRIYLHMQKYEQLEFDLFHDSPATWPRMKTGFEGLMKQYPNSKWNLNAFAYIACVANDADTYRVLRARLGQDVNPMAWASNYSVDVCDERLLVHP